MKYIDVYRMVKTAENELADIPASLREVHNNILDGIDAEADKAPAKGALQYGLVSGVGVGGISALIGALTAKKKEERLKKALKYGIIGGGSALTLGGIAGYGKGARTRDATHAITNGSRAFLNDMI